MKDVCKQIHVENHVKFHPDSQFDNLARNGSRTYYRTEDGQIYLLNHPSGRYKRLNFKEVDEVCHLVLCAGK